MGAIGSAGPAGLQPQDRPEPDVDEDSGPSSDSAAGTSHPRPEEPQAAFLLQDLLNRTSHDSLLPEWARCLDRPGHVKRLARKVLADGVVTTDEVRALVDEAESDYFLISNSERGALERMLEAHGERFEPSAREALAAFLVWKKDDGQGR